MRRLAAVLAVAAVVPAGTALAANPGNHGHHHGTSGHQGQGTTRANAARACRAERVMDTTAFADKYGTGPHKRNAFGKCVSQNKRQGLSKFDEKAINAAKTCKAEKAEDADAFRAKYGTNHTGQNAFGTCVSSHTRGHTSPTS